MRFKILFLIICILSTSVFGIQKYFSNFKHDDLNPLTSTIDCGETTSIYQRFLQLELLLRKSKHSLLSSPLPTSEHPIDSTFSVVEDDEPLKSVFVVSCNNQELPQELWHNFHKNLTTTPLPSGDGTQDERNNAPFRFSKPELFLWLGDAVYLDKGMKYAQFIRLQQTLASQRADFTRQLWREAYCQIRNMVPINGVYDDHDYGMNDADYFFDAKEVTLNQYLDFLDLPFVEELGVSRQWKQFSLQQCAAALECLPPPSSTPTLDSSIPTWDYEQLLGPTCYAQTIQTATQLQQLYSKIYALGRTTLEELPDRDEQILAIRKQISAYPQHIHDMCYITSKTIKDRDDTFDQFPMYLQFRRFPQANDTIFTIPVDESTTGLEAAFAAAEAIEKNNPDNISPDAQQAAQMIRHIAEHKHKQHLGRYEQYLALSRQFQEYRSLAEQYLIQDYLARRHRHGAYHSQTYGPLFKRVKVLLTDVRWGQVVADRMLDELQWQWLEQHLLSSVIPNIRDLLPRLSLLKSPSSQAPESQLQELVTLVDDILAQHRYDNMNRPDESIPFTPQSITTTIRTVINPRVPSNLNKYQQLFSCPSDQTSYTSTIDELYSLITNDPLYSRHGSDIILLGGGLLVVSYGKFMSEGWRVFPQERHRMLELSSRYMALSRHHIDELQTFIHLYRHVCGGEGSSNHQHKATETLLGLKSLSIIHLTGDIHFSEAARSYIPLDISKTKLPSPNLLLLNDPLAYERTLETKRKEGIHATELHHVIDALSLQDNGEIVFNTTHVDPSSLGLDETIAKGKSATHTIQVAGWNVLQALSQFLPMSYFPTSLISRDMTIAWDALRSFLGSEPSPSIKQLFSSHYVVPQTDITTSGVTHAWGGDGTTMSQTVLKIIDFAFRKALRFELTNIDYNSRTRYVLEELKLQLSHQQDTSSGAKESSESSSPHQYRDVGSFLDAEVIDTVINSQPLFYIFHNSLSLHIDWDNDILHAVVLDRGQKPAMYYTFPTSHHRAYSLNQVVGFSYQHPQTTKAAGPTSTRDQYSIPIGKSDSIVQDALFGNAYTQDIIWHLHEEISTRASPPSTLSHKTAVKIINTLLGVLAFGALISMVWKYYRGPKKEEIEQVDRAASSVDEQQPLLGKSTTSPS